MGIRGRLTEISPALFSQLVAGSDRVLLDAPSHSIDKAWNDFHQVFRSIGPPLSLAISGDCLHPQSSHTLDEFCAGGHEWYLGLVSPSLVRDVCIALAGWTPSDYKRLESELFGDQYNCGETLFPFLQAAYKEAATRNNALVIMVC